MRNQGHYNGRNIDYLGISWCLILYKMPSFFSASGKSQASLLGAAVTWLYRIETTGVDLDHIGEAAEEPAGSKAIA